MVDFEEIYQSALLSLGKKSEKIPLKVKDYFNKRKSEFRVSTWVERSGKIGEISYVDHEGPAGSNHRPAGVLEWVHGKLDGHKYVILSD
ncbi:EntF, Non-ribosomal peptide synthetase, partial [Pyrenophora tritici-repentis]